MFEYNVLEDAQNDALPGTENVIPETEDVTGSLIEKPTWDKTNEALGVMGKGMLGIFIVIGVIVVTIVLLNKFTTPKPKAQKEETPSDN